MTKKHIILDSAIKCAEETSLTQFTISEVAKSAGCTVGLIIHHYKSIEALRQMVMQSAADNQNLKIIAQGLAVGHPIARELPQELKFRAAATLGV